MTITVKIEVDDSRIQILLGDLRDRLELDGDVALDILDEVVHLIHAPQEFITVKADSIAASCTDELVVHFDPTDRFLVLMAALGAGNVD